MKTVKLRTNAKCAGCVAAIGKALDRAGLAGRWNIDLTSSDKTLTVETDMPAKRIAALVSEAGFKAEPLGL